MKKRLVIALSLAAIAAAAHAGFSISGVLPNSVPWPPAFDTGSVFGWLFS